MSFYIGLVRILFTNLEEQGELVRQGAGRLRTLSLDTDTSSKVWRLSSSLSKEGVVIVFWDLTSSMTS
jgi:hypothetical protein